MPSLWFIVPAYGRAKLAAICLRQLRRTCDALTAAGVDATAVVVADDENLETARELGFATVSRDNLFLSRRFNDGIQLALDERFNPRPADYVVPCGSDDWVDHRLFLELPDDKTMFGFRTLSFVSPDGRTIRSTTLSNHVGGCGIRVYPRALMEAVGYRPADEDRKRGCDTSILTNLRGIHDHRMRVEHRPAEPHQIIDWKSPDEQVTPYESVVARHGGVDLGDPFEVLSGLWPRDALDDMRSHYATGMVAA